VGCKNNPYPAIRALIIVNSCEVFDAQIGTMPPPELLCSRVPAARLIRFLHQGGTSNAFIPTPWMKKSLGAIHAAADSTPEIAAHLFRYCPCFQELSACRFG